MKGNLVMSEHKVEIVCISCGKTVKTKLIKFGDGYVAVCPLCKKLAYNVKFKDSREEAIFFKKETKQVVTNKRKKRKKRKRKKRKK